MKQFQPTLPARGATLRAVYTYPYREISTHAPRTGSDRRHCTDGLTPANFNPRSPHGERPAARNLRASPGPDFNPRSPHGERPVMLATQLSGYCISTHAPRTGSDLPQNGFFWTC